MASLKDCGRVRGLLGNPPGPAESQRLEIGLDGKRLLDGIMQKKPAKKG